MKKINPEEIKKQAKKDKNEFVFFEITTPKQPGDVAGSKLFKFFNHLSDEARKFFVIKGKEFRYYGNKSAKGFFVVKSRGFLLCKGPPIKDVKNAAVFIKEHKGIFKKNKILYSKEKINFGIKEFIENWKKRYKKKMKDMGISGLEIKG